MFVRGGYFFIKIAAVYFIRNPAGVVASVFELSFIHVSIPTRTRYRTIHITLTAPHSKQGSEPTF